MVTDGATGTGQRVPGFLYLDMDRIKSISSRLDEGYINEKIEQEEKNTEIASSLTTSIKARILGVGSGSVSGTIEGRAGSTTGVEESRALHHYYVPLLEDWLEQFEGDWFHDVDSLTNEIDGSYADRAARNKIASSVSEGDLVRIKGDVELLDFSTSLGFVDGMLAAIDDIDSALSEDGSEDENASVADSDIFQDEVANSSNDSSDLAGTGGPEFFGEDPDDIEAMKLIFNLFRKVMPDQYVDMSAMRVFPPIGNSQFWFWGLVQSDDLDVDPVELLSKYEDSKIPNCTVLARVETITEPQSSEEPSDETSDEDDPMTDFGVLHHYSDSIASNFGFKVSYPAISISPIAVYR